jgi:hypothetical protein
MTTAATEATGTRRKTQPLKTSEPKNSSRLPGQRPMKSRRRPALIALGVALAILGGLGSFYYASSLSNTITVLETKSDIARGAAITAADLTTLEITGGQGTKAFTPDQSGRVVGKIASVDLPAGTLVTPKNVGAGLAIQSGQSIVGVALTVLQIPSFPLSAGDSVRVVDTPVAQGEPPTTTPQSFAATVFTTKFNDKTSQWIVDLIVPEGKAADIAARAATGRVALVVDSSGGQ